MPKEIQILFVEDAADDAVLANHELRKAGLAFRLKRVETQDAFLQELKLNPPEVILSDHGLPSFDGFTALGLARERCPDVPFIFVTNTLTPEMKTEKLGGGVADHVLKSRLDYLPVAVQRALGVAAENRSRRQLLEELCAHVSSVAREKLMIPICSGCKRIRDTQNQWKLPEIFFRELLKIEYTHGLCPDCTPKYFPDASKPGTQPA